MEYYGKVELLNVSQSETPLLNGSFTDIDNADTTSAGKIQKIRPIMDIVLFVALVLVMLSMGVGVKKDLLLYYIKKPIGLSIGMFSQFVVLPLSAFILLHCVPVSENRATGVLLMACCPGGAFSNLFAYFCKGDLSLSVSMTSVSTLVAMGMMPFNLWLYGRTYETENIVIPYTRLALTLFFTTSTVAVGMLLRWKFPRFSIILMKSGTFISTVLVVIYIAIDAIVFPEMFTNIPRHLYGVMLSLPLIGFSLGYLMALLLRQNTVVCKTIAIECSIQNIPMALGVISISFPPEIQKQLVPVPYLYSFAMVSSGALFCCIYRVYIKCTDKKTPTKDPRTKETSDEIETLKCEETIEGEPMLNLKWEDTDVDGEIPDAEKSVK